MREATFKTEFRRFDLPRSAKDPDYFGIVVVPPAPTAGARAPGAGAEDETAYEIATRTIEKGFEEEPYKTWNDIVKCPTLRKSYGECSEDKL